ncbi:MAG: cobalamin-independent methionine synthase II family protein [Thalassobaculaceae bacterium]
MDSHKKILITHTGSLPRPKPLTQLYTQMVAGKSINQEILDQQIATATRWVIKQQRDNGIDIPNNGEQCREAFFLYIQRRMTGFGGRGSRKPWGDLLDFPEFAEFSQANFAAKTMVSNRNPPVALREVKYIAPEKNLEEIDDFKTILSEEWPECDDAFITAPSPGMLAAAMHNRYYENDEEYLNALGTAVSLEYHAAVNNGLLLQIDAPDLAMERHLTFADKPIGVFLTFIENVVNQINNAIIGIPADRIRLHVCWGNYEGPHHLDVPLQDILPILLKANVGGIMLPFANPRHQHEINVLRDIPLRTNQHLIVGVVDTLTNFIEHPKVIAQRIESATEAVGDPKKVQAGTDCGFDTAAGMGRVTSDIAWAKLKAMREGADIAATRLF